MLCVFVFARVRQKMRKGKTAIAMMDAIRESASERVVYLIKFKGIAVKIIIT